MDYMCSKETNHFACYLNYITIYVHLLLAGFYKLKLN